MAAAGPAFAAAAACSARSSPTIVPVVELYTSEGCSSCPPADRWMSRLHADPRVIALAFHVDYWDRLGWKDRFSSAAFTRRQREQQAPSGAGFSYTPQVIVAGADRKDWPRLTAASIASTDGMPLKAVVTVALERDASTFNATVTALQGAPMRLAAYWAVTDSGFTTQVRSGENMGATLLHDNVVREYRPVAAWTPRTSEATSLRFELTTPIDTVHPRDIVLVIIDADSGRPVQAIRLDC